MFWGLILEPGKRYSQEVIKAFHISMATLEIDGNSQTSQNVPVLLEYEDGREFVLCNLNPIKRVQCALDLNFRDGEKIGFYSGSGNVRVHLTGYMMADLEDDSSEGEGEEDDMVELLTNTEKTPQKRKNSPIEEKASKKMKGLTSLDALEEIRMEGSEKMNTPTTENFKEHEQQIITTVNGSVPQPVQKKKKKKKNLQETGASPKPASPKPASPQKKIIKGGIEIVDKVVGTGRVAQPGAKIAVYYVGRLQYNNKEFDSYTAGAGFMFVLGRNEVIKGWELGIPGMHVGGMRTLTIPAEMAYGKKGHPPIVPPNSTLVFDVELKKVYN